MSESFKVGDRVRLSPRRAEYYVALGVGEDYVKKIARSGSVSAVESHADGLWTSVRLDYGDADGFCEWFAPTQLERVPS